MAIHRDLPNSELHEPKHIQAATAPGDAGKVIVAKGDGTSELRKLVRADIPSIDQALTDLENAASGGATGLAGVYIDAAMATATVDVTIEGKKYYFIGPLAGQTVTLQMPDPLDTTETIHIKRLSATGTLLVVPFSAEQIEESTQLEILLKNNSIELVSDGTDWRII